MFDAKCILPKALLRKLSIFRLWINEYNPVTKNITIPTYQTEDEAIAFMLNTPVIILDKEINEDGI